MILEAKDIEKWNLFWTGYIEMTMVSISDFLSLDCWLPPKAKPFIREAEHCRAWERKESAFSISEIMLQNPEADGIQLLVRLH